MIESATPQFVNRRIAELIQEYDLRRNGPRGATILQELSELSTVRDALKKFYAGKSSARISRSLPQEFPTLDSLFFRLSFVGRTITELNT